MTYAEMRQNLDAMREDVLDFKRDLYDAPEYETREELRRLGDLATKLADALAILATLETGK